VTGDHGESEGMSDTVLCARCVRAPRDEEDRATWVTIDDDEICLGCTTLNDRERLRADEDR
jgi:coenzyme F420-reducing hydrogenase gamma subunit